MTREQSPRLVCHEAWASLPFRLRCGAMYARMNSDFCELTFFVKKLPSRAPSRSCSHTGAPPRTKYPGLGQVAGAPFDMPLPSLPNPRRRPLVLRSVCAITQYSSSSATAFLLLSGPPARVWPRLSKLHSTIPRGGLGLGGGRGS